MMKSIMLLSIVLLLFEYQCTVFGFSNQEDLSIRNSSCIGCLRLKSEFSSLSEIIETNFLLPYQTYSSPNLTIELCFRLCRRWFVLMFKNQTQCVCLHTILKPSHLTKYLGEIIPNHRCRSTDGQIFAVNSEFDILPSLNNIYDWSLDGCYYLQGIDQVRANLWLSHLNFQQAIDTCRRSCQNNRGSSFLSFFLSRRKSCYCLPIRFSSSVQLLAVRKPLIHCSFLPNLCQETSEACQPRWSSVHLDTVVKIDVHRQCLNKTNPFRYDSNLDLCLQPIGITATSKFSDIVEYHNCLPLSVRSETQWNSFTQSSYFSSPSNYVWIDEISVGSLTESFRLNQTENIDTNEFCFSIIKHFTNQTINFEFRRCSMIPTLASILCAQKPIDDAMPYADEFNKINQKSEVAEKGEIICPHGFILFNRMCYYFNTTFVYNRQSAQDACFNRTIHSSLVQFESHPWANINSTRFLGRTRDDSLLEFFYYQLEQKLLMQTSPHYTKKHWLRLLLANQEAPDECVLRYFTRSTGSFFTIHQCTNGGHPVCQMKSLPKQTKMNESIEATGDHSDNDLQITTTKESLMSLDLNGAQEALLFSTAVMPIFDSQTMEFMTDHGIFVQKNNHTDDNQTMNSTSNHTSTIETSSAYSSYQSLLVLLAGPVLALIILFVGINVLLCYLRDPDSTNYHERRPTRARDIHRKRSSTMMTVNEVPIANNPVVQYTRSKISLHVPDEDELLLSPNAGLNTNSESVQILSFPAANTLNGSSSLTLSDEPNYDHQDKEHLLFHTSS